MASIEFSGLDASDIKRQCEVETVPVTGDGRTEGMKKALNWLTE
jgi:hypothetical protein